MDKTSWISRVFSLYLFCGTFISALYAVTITVGPDIDTLTNTSITLTCTITDFQGLPHWTSNDGVFYPTSMIGGFGPGRRYIMEVSGDQYNLKMNNVQPGDDGEYQCRVGSEGQTVTVNVFVIPGPPMIEGVGAVLVEPTSRGHSVEIVTIPSGITTAQIECVVGPSKPAIPIKWFLDGVEIHSNVAPSILTVENDLVTSTSVLTIDEPSKRLNGAQYKCVADLSSINSPDALTPLNRVFNLSVQYPPSLHEIVGFLDGERQPGDTSILTCRTVGGNPLPALHWFRNGVSYNREFRTVEETSTVTSELVINITASDNQAEYKCEAKNAALPEPIVQSVTFSVKFPPTKVTITGHEKVKIGESITLSCTTSNSNPRAVITWFRLGQIQSTADEDTEVTNSADGGFITQTNLTVIPQRIDHEVSYMCQATTPGLRNLVNTAIVLDVLYPPDTLNITGFNATTAVDVDTPLKMLCTANGGNPLPTLTWYKGSTPLTAYMGNLVTQGQIRSRQLSIIAKPEDNDAIFKCAATSPASAAAKEDFRTVSVHFPPQEVVITPDTPMKDGESVTLTCNSGSSNPVSQITWQKNETRVLASSVREVRVEDGAFGGKVTISSYTFTPLASDNGLVVLCSARNERIGRSTTQGKSLNVLHKPIFSDVPNVLRLLEAKNLTGNNFAAEANPADVTYTWFKVDGDSETALTFDVKRDGATPELSAVGSVLNLININRNRAGTYRVKGTNSEGTNSADFRIDVQYGAGIPSTPTQTEENNTLKLHCVVDANPPVTKSQAKWTRLDYDMSRTNQTISGSGNIRTVTLTIPGVVRDDIGIFTCEASNMFGSATKEYTVTPVPFAPEIDRSPSTSKSAAQTHNDGVIKCNLDAYPMPTITWSKAGNAIDVQNDDKYSMTTETQGQIHFSFKLIISNIVQSDYGAYKCHAQNPTGTDVHEIILNGTSKPDPPTEVTVLNVTDSSVILNWVAGFDGGLEQTFHIKYHIPALGSQGMMYADAENAPFTVTGLQGETEYEFTVRGFNKLGNSAYSSPAVSAHTLPAPTVKSQVMKPEEPMFIVIMALAVVGGLLLIVTTVLVCIFVRRRRRRKLSEATDSASQSNNTVELYGTHDGDFHDDAKSYSTYEKGFEDDDFAKHYEDDNSINHNTATADQPTYVTATSIPYQESLPWLKAEDPHGNFGAYARFQQSAVSGTTDTELYANALRGVTKAMQHTDTYQRPAFVAGRPPPPPPPGRTVSRPMYAEVPPTVPERHYSPLGYPPLQPELYHASRGRSSPSVESTDDMKGHLV